MPNRFSLILAAIFATVSIPLSGPAAPAFAQAAGDSVTVQEAWARASAGAASVGAAYVALKGGARDDALTGVSTPVADSAMVHQTTMDNGVARMRDTPSVAVPANQTVTFAPGGDHIMLMGLKHPLAEGEKFPITLTFAHTPPVTVEVTVRGIGGHDHMKM